jgi:hypothetical protein
MGALAGNGQRRASSGPAVGASGSGEHPARGLPRSNRRHPCLGGSVASRRRGWRRGRRQSASTRGSARGPLRRGVRPSVPRSARREGGVSGPLVARALAGDVARDAGGCARASGVDVHRSPTRSGRVAPKHRPYVAPSTAPVGQGGPRRQPRLGCSLRRPRLTAPPGRAPPSTPPTPPAAVRTRSPDPGLTTRGGARMFSEFEGHL